MSLQRLYQLDRSFAEKLDKVLHDDEYIKLLLKLPPNELVELVNYLNDTITRLDRTGGQTRKCLHVLRKICSTQKVLPDAYDVSKTLSVSTINPFAYGGFSDAHRGHLDLREDVFVKRLRVSTNCDMGKIKELLCQEAIVWKRVNHPNIVPFRGVTLDPLQLVSQWMPGGELREHVKKNKDANLIDLLLDIAKGLAYLHSCDLVHGDLKGPNVVLDASGHARITDFGLASVIRDPSSVASSSDASAGYSPRWSAPEVFREGAIPSKKADVFSFAMIVFEIYSGTAPFQRISSTAVPTFIMRGERPSRPTHPGLNDRLWDLTQRCWKDNAKHRPDMEEIIQELVAIKSAPPKPAPPNKPSATTVESERRPGSAQDTPRKKKTNETKDTGVTPYDMNPIQPATKPPTPKLEVKGPPAPKEIATDWEIVGPSVGPPHIPIKDAPVVHPETKTQGEREHDKHPKKDSEDMEHKANLGHKKSRRGLQRGPKTDDRSPPITVKPDDEIEPTVRPPVQVASPQPGKPTDDRGPRHTQPTDDQWPRPSGSSGRPPNPPSTVKPDGKTESTRQPTDGRHPRTYGQSTPEDRNRNAGGPDLPLQLPTPSPIKKSAGAFPHKAPSRPPSRSPTPPSSGGEAEPTVYPPVQVKPHHPESDTPRHRDEAQRLTDDRHPRNNNQFVTEDRGRGAGNLAPPPRPSTPPTEKSCCCCIQ